MKIIRPITVNDAALISSNIPETDYAAYSSGTTYALGARVIVVAANVHKIYESLQAGNLNHTPASSPTYWLEIGATNRWRMFDYSVTSQSTNANSIDVTIQASGRANAIALVNVDAATVQVIMTDATEGEVYNATYSLVSTAGIDNPYAYFFEPIVRLSDYAILDLPPYYAATIQVIVSAPGATVSLGGLLIGQQLKVGELQYGAEVGIVDYSVKTRNAFGDFVILERAYSKRATFPVMITKSMVSHIEKMLGQYRATPIVYVGSELYGATLIFGFYKS